MYRIHRIAAIMPNHTGLTWALRSVELSFLTFSNRTGGYQSLVDGMRDTLGWGERPKAERPKVIIRFPFNPAASPMQRFCDVNDAVTKYIHGERERNAFPNAAYDRPEFGAFVMHDAFLPQYERPTSDPYELKRLGITK